MTKKIIITISVLLVVAGALFGISRIEPVRMYIDEQIAYYNKIKEIKEELDKEIHRNMFLVNDEEYEITSIKVTKLEKLPLAEEDYNKYHINKNTIPFVFTIKSASGEEDTLYILYRDDVEKGYTVYENSELYDYLRKFSIISTNNSDIPVTDAYHEHWWECNIFDGTKLLHCTRCTKAKKAYDIEKHVFNEVYTDMTEEEIQELLDAEKNKIEERIIQYVKGHLKIKGAASYEITSIGTNAPFTPNSYDGFIKISASNGFVGNLKVDYRFNGNYWDVGVFTSRGLGGNGNMIYDPEENWIYWE